MNKLLANPIERNGQRVLTTAQLAEAYNTSEKRISENYNRNHKHYIEGKHFYCLIGDELKAFKSESANCGFAQNLNILYLWTEKGALLHAKSLNTDKAWEAYDYLIDHYFRSIEILTYYNDTLVKILENHEQKLDKLEREISYIRNDVLDVRRSAMVINDKFEDAKQFVNNTLEKAVSETVKVLT